MTVVIGTAGHIDHGKTALLRALTGIDADRLPEERRRGMTIDVGYAHLALPDGSEIDFVDVPGHDRLVGNMLVGAGEIDATMLVVAADDGPRAQTLEHLELLDGLGIEAGLAVVTKTDLVDRSRVATVGDEVRALLARTSLRDAPVVTASSVSGDGIDALRAGLVALRDSVVARDVAVGPSRLAIDRVFTVRGRGLVVTGTLRGAPIARGEALRLVPGEQTVRVREVQVHGAMVESAGAGRVALNLAGIDASALHRGMVLTADPSVEVTDRWLVALRPAAPLARPTAELPHDRARLRLHTGTDEVGVSVSRNGREAIVLPTGEVSAVVRLERPVAVAAGDRFVLRRPSPAVTEAGGRVLEPRPPRGVSRRRVGPDRLAALAVATAVGDDPTAARLALHGVVARDHAIALAPDVEAALAARACELVAAAHASDPDAPGIPLAALRVSVARELRRLVTVAPDDAQPAAGDVLARLVRDGRLARDAEHVRDPAHRPAGPSPALLAAMDRLEAALSAPAPPPLTEAARAAGCPADGIRLLEASGRIVRVGDDLAWSAATYRRLAAHALAMASRAPLAPAAFRDATGTSRKYVMAILEDLDRRGILRRTPAGHVPGPRAPVETRS